MSITSLPMYDLPEIRPTIDAWWSGVARHLREAGVADVPDRVDRELDRLAAWRSPQLCLAQTCGYPLTHDLAGWVAVVATPCYRAPGCRGATYSSVIAVQDGSRFEDLHDLRGRIAAYNGRDSHSGYNVLRAMLAPLAKGGRFLAGTIESGGHMASLLAVQQGKADLAAIDCVTFALAKRHRPSAVAGLRILAESPPAPGLPYVTTAKRSPEELAHLRAGLLAAVKDPALAAERDALLLDGFELLPEDAYETMVAMERSALGLGYALLN